MKRLTIMMLALMVMVGGAMAEKTAQETKKEKNPSVVKLMASMAKLQTQSKYLEAMDSATLALSMDENNMVVKNFVRKNWDKMMDDAQRKLRLNPNSNDLDQIRIRLDVYRLLEEIYANLSGVKMPLYGPSKSWNWQPDVAYYQGDYSNERISAFRAAKQNAEVGITSKDADAVRTNYYFIVKELLTEQELKGRLAELVERCNTAAEKYIHSSNLNGAIFAHEMTVLSLELQPNDNRAKEMQSELSQRVAEIYGMEAQEAKEAGDTIQADLKQKMQQDWKSK